MNTTKEIESLRAIAAKQKVEALRRRAQQRAEELRNAPATSLRYPNERKSVIAVHAQDAQHGTLRETFVMRRGAL